MSLQALLYAAEAEKKGATPTEYGLVFHVSKLTVVLMAPFLGKNINRFGAKRVFNLGIFTTGMCSILLGLLDNIENRTWFIALSFLIKVSAS